MNFNLKQTKKFFLTKKHFNNYQEKVLDFLFLNFANLVDVISKNLSSNWSFSEISHFDKGLLLVMTGEFFTHQVEKKIIIAEAIKIAQKFNSPSAFIHKVLDLVLATDENFGKK